MIFASLAMATPLDFAVGCWQSQEVAESWLPARHDTLIGVAHAGSASSPLIDTMRFTEREGAWVFTALLGTEGETDFEATIVTDDRVVVENPSHDFPQRLDYRRVPDGLFVRIETLDGAKGFDLSLSRCDALPTSEPAPVRPLPCREASSKRSRSLARLAGSSQDEAEGSPKAAARRGSVEAHILAGAVCSEADAYAAATVLQHSPHPAHLRRAYDLFDPACQANDQTACTAQGIAWDRWLVAMGRPKWYGDSDRHDAPTGPARPGLLEPAP